jgi:ATP-dependent DNA helicase RecG
MTERKLKAPEIRDERNSVVVTIPHAPLASPAESILDFLKTNNTITNSQARDITGIKSENQVKAEFYKLRDRCILEMVPERRGAYSAWRLIAPPHTSESCD